ncbi:MAG: hypothetical protein WCF19_07865, partial [Chlamydiales bacterium]
SLLSPVTTAEILLGSMLTLTSNRGVGHFSMSKGGHFTLSPDTRKNIGEYCVLMMGSNGLISDFGKAM